VSHLGRQTAKVHSAEFLDRSPQTLSSPTQP